MPFTEFGLHHDLQRGVKELGFTRPTPIQKDAIPPAMEGRDVLACAMTGSGKTAAFLLPILHRLMAKPRRTTRALVLTPTRELAAQIGEHLNELAVHTPLTGASVFGGVGMGPQEHAFRSGVDVIVATPGRLLDHFRFPYARLAGLEVLVLDEADRMLDMGFLPDIRRVLKHLPQKRQTLFFSATLPAPIVTLSREMLKNPVTINLERKAAPAVGITHAVYPVAQHLKSGAAPGASQAGRGEERHRLHPHQAPGEPARRSSGQAGGPGGADPRQPVPGPEDGGAGGVQEREVPAPGGHRHRRPGDRRGGPQPRGQLRRAGAAGRLHPPGRADGTGRGAGRRVHARFARGGPAAARHRAGGGEAAAPGDRSRGSTIRRSRRSGWRFRWRSGWRPCGRAGARREHAPGRRRRPPRHARPADPGARSVPGAAGAAADARVLRNRAPRSRGAPIRLPLRPPRGAPAVRSGRSWWSGGRWAAGGPAAR